MQSFNKWKWVFVIAINWIYWCHISQSEIIANVDFIGIWILKIVAVLDNVIKHRLWWHTWASDSNSRKIIFADTNSDKHRSFEMSASEQTEISSITNGTRWRINNCLQKYSIVVLVTVESNFALKIFKVLGLVTSGRAKPSIFINFVTVLLWAVQFQNHQLTLLGINWFEN